MKYLTTHDCVDRRDYFCPVEINLEVDSEETPAPDNNTNFTFVVGSDDVDSDHFESKRQSFDDTRRLNLGILKQGYENVFVSFDGSSPDLLVTEDDKRSGSVDSNPDLSPFSLYDQFHSADIVINVSKRKCNEVGLTLGVLSFKSFNTYASLFYDS